MDNWVIGIDEAGRGPLAGPVFVGCVAMREQDRRYIEGMFIGVKGRDSKKLTPSERLSWYEEMMRCEQDGVLRVCHGSASARFIDKKGIVPAVRYALAKGLYGLHIEPVRAEVLLDGGLYAPKRFTSQQTFIKGDETELPITLGSIVAKVRRDAYLRILDSKYVRYGFAQHKGYGTKMHRRAIKRYGVTPEHRRCFLRKILPQ